MADYTIRELFAAKPAENMENVKVSGWVRTMRESKTFAFVELNDGSYFKNLQIILDEAELKDYRELVKKIGVGASLEVCGTLVRPNAEEWLALNEALPYVILSVPVSTSTSPT